MVTEQQVLEALRPIMDPDLGKDIVSLGFVKNIRINPDLVAFDIELTTPACPVKSRFQQEAQDRVMRLEGVRHVNVNMTSRTRTAAQTSDGLGEVATIIAVASCKGGVGKSTVAAHLARELARRGHATGLLDADLFGPSVPTLFNVHVDGVNGDAAGMIIPVEARGVKLMSFGFLLGDGPAVMRGPMVSGYMNQILKQVAWGKLDFLIIDMPPGTGDIQLTITQAVTLSGAVMVTTRQSLSLVDVARGIMMFEKVNVPLLGVVENMSYFVCDACNAKHVIFGSENQRDVSEQFGLPMLARLPIEKSIAESVRDTIAPPESVGTMVDAIVRTQGMQSAQENLNPTVTYNATSIQVVWPDGTIGTIDNRTARLACGCAVCHDEYTGEAKVDPGSLPTTIQPTEITPLGNYAVRIAWNDGHETGIYPYRQLQTLSGTNR